MTVSADTETLRIYGSSAMNFPEVPQRTISWGGISSQSVQPPPCLLGPTAFRSLERLPDSFVGVTVRTKPSPHWRQMVSYVDLLIVPSDFALHPPSSSLDPQLSPLVLKSDTGKTLGTI